nr:MAG TPA: hypothetical protein [Caudoviricetes sp.]
MITNADITIYNLAHKGTRNEKWIRTFISGVNWYGGQKVTVTDTGLLTADAYTVRISVSSEPEGKVFVLPEDYALEEDDALAGFWTLQNGDLIYRGNGPEIIQATEITGKSESFVVTGWSDNRRGSSVMQHWRIEGK